MDSSSPPVAARSSDQFPWSLDLSAKISGAVELGRKLDPARFKRVMSKSMEETTSVGVEVMRDVVETSGTDRLWARPWYGRTGSGRGRIDTGTMLKDIAKDPVTDTSSGVKSAFGWVKGSPTYAVHQEYGFTHVLTGEVVQGMHAMRQAEADATDEAVSSLSNGIQDFLRG